MRINNESGFTLLEILIAMFIFAILSLILSGALHNVINIQERTEISAERLRELQLANLFLSRDIEQTVNRPILNSAGKQEAAFIGTGKNITFTHAGVASYSDKLVRSNMQRVSYAANNNVLWQNSWTVLDQAPDSLPRKRELLADVTEVRFEFLDDKNKVHKEWPIAGQSNTQPLPHVIPIQTAKQQTPGE
jgi:general secretion pathway protein J